MVHSDLSYCPFRLNLFGSFAPFLFLFRLIFYYPPRLSSFSLTLFDWQGHWYERRGWTQRLVSLCSQTIYHLTSAASGMAGTWHLASKMVSKLCRSTYTFGGSGNLHIDNPWKWLSQLLQPCWGTVCCTLPVFQLPAGFPTPIQRFSPSSSMNAALLHIHALAHTITPPPSELSGRGGGEAKSSAFWELVFYFFKGPSGPLVCMADSLDLIPGLIQSLSQISLVQHGSARLGCPCVYY